MFLRKSLLIILLSSFLSVSLASKHSCDEVVISGDIAWPPFSYADDAMLKGVGIDLAQMLFFELDIPVKVKLVQKTADLGYYLRHGEVDVIVGTYDVPEYKNIAQLLTPAYYDDMISVVVPKDREFVFDEWEDLQGKIGMSTEGGQLGKDFDSYAGEHLFLDKQKGLRFVLKKLKHKHIDYAVGSKQQLTAGINSYNMQADISFLDKDISAESVFLGFSKVSACQQYAPYLKTRLEQLLQDGTIDELIEKHTKEVKLKEADPQIQKKRKLPKELQKDNT